MYTYVFIYIHMNTYVYICIHIYTYEYICIYMYTYVYICIHMYTYVYIYLVVLWCFLDSEVDGEMRKQTEVDGEMRKQTEVDGEMRNQTEKCALLPPRSLLHVRSQLLRVCVLQSTAIDYGVATTREYRFFYRALLQKRPILLKSLLIVATP